MKKSKSLEGGFVAKGGAGVGIDVGHHPPNITLGEFIEGRTFGKDQTNELMIAFDLRFLP